MARHYTGRTARHPRFRWGTFWLAFLPMMALIMLAASWPASVAVLTVWSVLLLVKLRRR